MVNFPYILPNIRKNNVLKQYLENQSTIELWDKDSIQTYTIDAINELCNFVYENNEYYREKLKKINFNINKDISIEDFEKIDFLTKQELRDNPYLILSVPREIISQIYTSTGTTGGENIYMMHTLYDLLVNDFAPKVDKLFNIYKGDVVINALPYEMSSSGQSFHRVVQFEREATVIPVGKGGFYSEPSKTLKIIKDLQANILISTPSYVMNLLSIGKNLKYNFEKDFNLKQIWLTGEGCSNNFRKRIETEWKCCAKFYYGSLEGGPLGIECDFKNGYHITQGHSYIEIINPKTGLVLKPMEIGEIVITTLLREGSPLIRYRTGDIGYIDKSECNCNCKLPKLFLRGRECDQININGITYSPLYLEEILMSIDEVGNNYILYIHDTYLRIVIEPREKFKYPKQVEDLISIKFKNLSNIPNKVEFIDKINYPGGKVKRIVYINK